MIVTQASTFAIVYDMFLLFGLSIGMWLAYHILCLLMPMKHVASSIAVHILFFTVAGLLCFCFILGQTESRQPRWHMLAGFVLGAFIYYSWFARYVKQFLFLIEYVLRLLIKPAVKLWKLVKQHIFDRIVFYLHKKRSIMYNHYIKKRNQRKSKRSVAHRGSEQTEQKKQPIKAYTQT